MSKSDPCKGCQSISPEDCQESGCDSWQENNPAPEPAARGRSYDDLQLWYEQCSGQNSEACVTCADEECPGHP